MRHLLILLLIGSALTGIANAQKIRGPSPVLRAGDIKQVVRGDPQIANRIAGSIVVAAPWYFSSSLPPGMSAAMRRYNGADRDKRIKDGQEFAKELAQTMRHFQGNTDVLVVALHPGGSSNSDANVLALADQLKLTAPIVKLDTKDPAFREIYWGGFSVNSVVIFNHRGVICYNGRLGREATAAIREAVREKLTNP